MTAVRRVVGQAYRRLGPAPACSRRERRWLLVIVVIAIALRLAWVLYAAREPRGFHDPTLYEVFAARIADGHGYTAANGQATTYYPVGYIGALGAVVWLVGQTSIPENVSMTAAVFNLVLGVGAIALTFEATLRPSITLAAARRSPMRELVQLPMNTRSSAISWIGVPASSPM